MAGVADVLRIEVAWASDPWATSPTWTDLTNISDAERALRGPVSQTITKGRTGGAGGLFTPSEMTAVFNNNDADFDPANTSTVFGAANLVRNKRIRARVSDDDFGSQISTLFDGYISNIEPAGDEFSGLASVTARDLLGLLAEYDVNGLVRPAEFTGERVAAILSDVGLPAAFQGTIDNGTEIMPAATLEGQALDLLQQCQKAEYGLLYAEAGVLSFRERYAVLEESVWSTRSHSFTATGLGFNSKVLRHPIGRTLGSFANVSRVVASRTGSAIPFDYDTTAANYPPTTPADGPFDLSVAYDASIQVAAQAWHRGWDFSGERVRDFRVKAHPDHDNAITAIRAGYYDPLTRVEVQSLPAGFNSDLNFEARIEQVTHTIGLHEWTVDFSVSPYQTQWVDDGAGVFYEFGETLSAFDLGAL